MTNFKLLFLLLGILLYGEYSSAQCVDSKIPKSGWNVHYFDSEEAAGEGANNGKAIYAIDGDSTKFWHTQWQGAQPGYPHEIQINLGSSHDVSGISLLSRYDNPYGKAKQYEIYLSNDGTNWQVAQSTGDFTYPNVNAAAQRTYVFFGAVAAQYVRIKLLSSYGNYYYSVISEIDIYENLTCPATGQNNQLATFDAIPKKYTNDVPFTVNATTNSGLPINYTIVSGPATIAGNTITLNGTGGTVVVKAAQSGDATFYPWEQTRTFEVVDLTTIQPQITTRFTVNKDIQMPQLDAYLLHAFTTIDEPTQLSVTSLEYIIDGTSYPAIFKNNSWQYWWTPSQYGAHTVQVKATASNGQSFTENLTLNVSNTIANTLAQTFNGDVIDMGTIGSQWFYGSYELPQFTAAYNKIIADFAISCPSVPGGCDDWDRLGWIEVKAPNGDWVEVIRYITPYGVPCSQSIDLMDFASILQGNVEFRMYIETWGTGGWKLNLKLNYEAGTPEYKYSSVEELWHGDYSFGNPANLQPTGARTVAFEPELAGAKIRLVSTGHGWGNNNTSNAAEFYHALHHIDVDGVNMFDQDLWQNCNPNPANCTGQQGTWQYNRAGWCPGSMGMVFNYDLDAFMNQPSVQLDYIFQESYMDNCHPNNPNCVSGVTCTDCNDSYNPYYRVGSYVIKYSNVPFVLSTEHLTIQNDLEATVYPNPTKGDFQLQLNNEWKHVVVSIQNIAGDVVQTRFFSSEKELNAASFSINNLASGVYFLKIQSEGQFATMKLIKE
ncbi:MAG: discoidin domain-containing protein [Crocinitomicaceae bacterium]|nr:discoidin domain-containing protein [Crocinitomicaceae bacterium]